MTAAGRAPTVLLVCTANVCRSPTAAALLSARWNAPDEVQVASAGTRARVGRPFDPAMASLLGAALEHHAARQVSSSMIGDAALVLAMTRAQRAALVAAVPSAVRRTFTLPEFAELTALAGSAGVLADPAPLGDRLRAVLTEVPRLRASRRPGPQDDVEDPFGQEMWVYARVLSRLRRLTEDLGVLAPLEHHHGT